MSQKAADTTTELEDLVEHLERYRATTLQFFEDVRSFTLEHLRSVDPDDLGTIVEIPDAPMEHSLRSILWFVLEHELHHRGQIWGYLRPMEKTPPFYAAPLPLGQRPDIEAREELGEF